MDRLAGAFAYWQDRWEADGFAPIRQAWLNRALGMGGRCTVRLDAETLTGMAEGLAEDGALALRMEDGVLRRISAGDVFFGDEAR